jgi:hypothetical protein
MKNLVTAVLCLALPVIAFAGEGDNPTCDACINVDGQLFPTPAWQTVNGSIVGQANSEYTYSFCATQGGTYTFSTCEDSSPGAANYDTAISGWTNNGGVCGVNLVCNDDNCAGSVSVLHSFVTFTAATGGEYLVVVDGFSSATGDYTLAYMGPECTPTPTGACCTASGCAVTTQAQCAGQYMGDGTDCDPDPCVVPVENATWGSIKSTYK